MPTKAAAAALQVYVAHTPFHDWLVGPTPCDDCRNFELCRGGLAWEAFVFYHRTGRVSQVAPRRPSRAIYEEIYRVDLAAAP